MTIERSKSDTLVVNSQLISLVVEDEGAIVAMDSQSLRNLVVLLMPILHVMQEQFPFHLHLTRNLTFLLIDSLRK